ncbi:MULTISPECIES: hypothetical protein [Cyanophyceae]|jgi:hypothetical protein|uniref:hypothetical protein n=1 Tax=Cyanophyceae TaxID=3028117 RepID=UPI0002DA9CA0|nr:MULTISPECIES: hypothetical protein [Cyanophyceae]AMA08905.1 hypothetical protein AWQ23_06030 [Picosynechococcus sp. PCC 73109]ANV87053.1 hypothetical protein AWQ22_06030 [Picosynechococcus sp. PCC 7117]ANV90206.1 hypothetical protein AWQ24_05975 [Picosynechococcus sp. PCC 8807]QCS49750.1 hypothetical protein FEK30_10020 [Picosynechococcus sp. PCC 11901]SMH34052.1 hypothetical protein SAMN06272755_0528 [Picosynechococcus sp. OG1]
MQDKQKVTLYLPAAIHRQLKIKAALDADSMSALVEKAVAFYLQHPEVVEEVQETYGQTHRVHICPDCEGAVVLRDGQLVSLKRQPTVLLDEEIAQDLQSAKGAADGAELVTC